jgi:hypothetical protein
MDAKEQLYTAGGFAFDFYICPIRLNSDNLKTVLNTLK